MVGLTYKEAHSLFSYNPETGELCWKRPPRRGVDAGPAGSVNSAGYRIVTYRKHLYMATHIIWFLMTGQWPTSTIDHKDRNSLNDAWENLREATYGENNCNQGIRKDNPTGVRGVLIHKKTGAFEARIRASGRQIYLGRFRDLESAAAARRAGEIKYHGEFASFYGDV